MDFDHVLSEWPKDWPTHAAKQDLAPLLSIDAALVESIIVLGQLQPDAEGDYSLQEFFRAGASLSKKIKRKSGFFDISKILRKVGF